MATTVHTFTTNLVTNLRARPNLKGTTVTDGSPPVSVLQVNEWISIGDASGEQHYPHMSGTRRTKEEIYELEVLISVVQAATTSGLDDHSAITKRAVELFSEIEDELRTNPTQGVELAGTQTTPYLVMGEIADGFNLYKRANDTARESAIICRIKVRARI